MKPIEEKAVRLVRENKVRVTFTNQDITMGRVQGDTGGPYNTSVSPEGNSCTCKHGQESPYTKCSHIWALELAVAAEAEGVMP